jgi:hypothetical protein
MEEEDAPISESVLFLFIALLPKKHREEGSGFIGTN